MGMVDGREYGRVLRRVARREREKEREQEDKDGHGDRDGDGSPSKRQSSFVSTRVAVRF